MKNCFKCKTPYSSLSSRSFHQLPKDAELREKWIEILQISNLTKIVLICSDHFDVDCFHQGASGMRTKLVPGAIPSAFQHSSNPLPAESFGYNQTGADSPIVDCPRDIDIDRLTNTKEVQSHMDLNDSCQDSIVGNYNIGEEQCANSAFSSKMYNHGPMSSSTRKSALNCYNEKVFEDVEIKEEMDITEQFVDGEGIYDKEIYETATLPSLVDQTFEIQNDSCVANETEILERNSSINENDIKVETTCVDFEEQISLHCNLKQNRNHSCDSETLSDAILKPYGDHVYSKQQQCGFCDYATFDESTLEKHVNSVHLKAKEFKCHSCDYVGGRKAALKRHIDAVHLKVKKHKCHFCDAAAAQKSVLKAHIESVHLKLKEHKCHLCDYAAARKGVLEIHINSVHFKLKKHKCHFCDYAATLRENLKHHINSVHLEAEGFKCHLCDYVVDRKSSFKRHMDSVHFKLKKHQCHSCDYDATQKSDLKKHIESVHLNLKKHKCHLCDFTSVQKSNLKGHINSVHLNIKKHKF